MQTDLPMEMGKIIKDKRKTMYDADLPIVLEVYKFVSILGFSIVGNNELQHMIFSINFNFIDKNFQVDEKKQRTNTFTCI